MTSTEFDDFPLSTWTRGRRRTRRNPVCDHATCPGCGKCSCHSKPKKPILEPLTQVDAKATGAQLRLAALRAITLLDAVTSTSKTTRPVSHLEQAIERGHADLDNTLRSPSLNGAVSGGDDPSWRMLDQIGITPEKRDEAGNLSGGNLRERYDATTAQLEKLVGAIEQIERSAAAIDSVVDELRAIPPDEAKRLLEADSDVQHCVNCGKVVAGTRDDRLRAGRCSTCNKYKREHDGRDRPKSLIEKEVAREMAAASTIPATTAGNFSSSSEDCASSALPDRR